jgi:hypothetical protein
LDLGLSLSYNSLVWTKAGTTIFFDADHGTPSPGFRLGFPVIEAPYFNTEVGANNYLLITPSGARVELRQVGATNIYEAADSSYLQLTDNGNGSLLLKDTGGTQYSYSSAGGEYHCDQIKDRNGNYFTVTYRTDGQINTITDTLARTITFNYDPNFQSLTSITQPWGTGSTPPLHKWVTFGWQDVTIDTSFTDLTVVGPQDNSTISALQWVSFADGTSYSFDYNTRLQVTKVTRKYPNGTTTPLDDSPLSYTSYVYTGSYTDCPRPSQQRVWAKDWKGDDDGIPTAAEEAATTYTFDTGVSGEAKTPDNTYYKELFDPTPGWKKGLTTGTQVTVGSSVMKSTTTAWTQDDENLPYRKNPRPATITVTDGTNTRKTTIGYFKDTATSISLPQDVSEYAANGNTVLRRTHTDYNWGTVYKTKRIIGLPLTTSVYGENNALASKVTYEYDEAAFFEDDGTPTNHDSAGYPATTISGRGNLTSVKRWDVNAPTDSAKVSESNIGYNNSGSVVLNSNALGQQTTISYSDDFSDPAKNSLNTLAYPTKVTPPGHDN